MKSLIALFVVAALSASAQAAEGFLNFDCQVPAMKSSMKFGVTNINAKRPGLKSLRPVNGVREPQVYVFDQNGRNVTGLHGYLLNTFNYADWELVHVTLPNDQKALAFRIDEDGFVQTNLYLTRDSGYTSGYIRATGEKYYTVPVKCTVKTVMPLGAQG